MTELLLTTWPSIAAAAALGLAFTAVGGLGRAVVGSTAWFRIVASIGVLACLVLSWSGLVAGRPGLWLDLAAPLVAAYAIGSLIGVAVHRRLAAAKPMLAVDAGLAVPPSVDAERPAA